MNTEPVAILLVDHDPGAARAARAQLSDDPAFALARVDHAATAAAAVARVAERDYDLLLIDERLGTDGGAPLLRQLRAAGLTTPAVILTASDDPQVVVEAMRAGATDCLVKDRLVAGSLAGVLRHALELERSRRERQHAEGELRLRDRAIAALRQGLLITDPRQLDNPVIYVNPGFERITGYASDQVLGRNCRFLQGRDTDPEVVGRIRSAVAEGRAITVELLNYRRDGQPFWNLLSITPLRDDDGGVAHFVGLVTDVTARRLLEEQLGQAQRLEAVGRLAGGIAHDFNNTLGVILGHGELALGKLAPDAPARRHLEEIERAAQHAATSTRQLLAYGRRQILAPQVLDPNASVAALVPLLTRALGEDVRIETQLGSVCAIRADAAQLESALTTLALNARDAMPGGGRLRIETYLTTLGEDDPRREPATPPGPYVGLRLTDQGRGIEASRLAHVFEPFFGVAAEQQIPSLGLAMVHGIVHQSGGQITVRSQPGSGTTFDLLLPCLAASPSQPSVVNTEVPQRQRTILVVEDEDALRELVSEVLVDLGYRVLTAGSGELALEVCLAHGAPLDLVVSDVVLPGISGSETVRRLASSQPGLRVLYMSGYTDDVMLRAGVLAGETHFMAKPFTAETLARKVEEALG